MSRDLQKVLHWLNPLREWQWNYTRVDMRARCLFALCITTGLQAQPNPADVLRMAQAKIGDSLDRTLRYMCTQTVDRASYQPNSNSRYNDCEAGLTRAAPLLISFDRLRVDVAMGSIKEMYSWVGENRFEDRDLTEMVQEGAISTGNYAGLLSSIFGTDNATFTYNGDSSEDGRTFAEFGFLVPYAKSHYLFRERGDGVLTGYSGTFLVNANTGDLVRLVVRTNRLPAQTGACYADTTLNYALVRLSDRDTLLLPTDSRLHIVNTDGSESENHIVLSACHRFLGESTISFDSRDAADASTPHPASHAVTIPPGLPFRVASMQGIDTATAAAGDPIKAKLITPIRAGSKTLVPAGAPVGARIVGMHQFYGPAPSVVVNIKLETVDVAGQIERLDAIPDNGGRFQKPRKGSLQRPVELGTLRSLEGRSGTYVFRDFSGPFLIQSGLESSWVTASPIEDSVSTLK